MNRKSGPVCLQKTKPRKVVKILTTEQANKLELKSNEMKPNLKKIDRQKRESSRKMGHKLFTGTM